jgi:large subunit ribosomal protein L9
MWMKVILQRDVPKVGKGGEMVNVADGFARNYLLPRGHAVAASGGALKELMARASHEKHKEEKLRGKAVEDASRLEGLALILIGKVGAGTKLYGSITAQDVAEGIHKETGVTIDKRRVGLVDPIKNLGVFHVPVRLHGDVTVSVTVDVTTEDDLERRKVQAAAAATLEVEAAPSAEVEPAAD